MNEEEVNIDTDNNYISIMNHIITIDDMIDNLYYRTNIAWAKNVKAINLLYFKGLKETSKLSLNTLLKDRLVEAVGNANRKRAIFRYIDYDLCDKYNLYTIKYKKSGCNNNDNGNGNENDICIKIFRNDDIASVISNLEPLCSTLKFKIKEERLTRNLRNDLNDFTKSQYINNIKFSNDMRKLKRMIITENNYMKTIIYSLSISMIVNFTLFGFLLF
jgi:hypothetical protein